MSEPAISPPPESSATTSGANATRRVQWRDLWPVVAAAPGLVAGVTILVAGDSLATTTWGLVLFCTAATAALTTIVALGSRTRETNRIEFAAHRAFADEMCAAHGQLSVRCDELAAERTTAHQSWQALFTSASHIGVIATDARGRITACNPGASRLLGRRVADLVDRACILDFHRTDELAARRGTGSAGRAETDLATWAATAHHESPESTPWTWQRADGTSVQVALSITARRDAEGATVGYLALAEDLTAKALAAQRALAIQLASRALLDATALADALPKILHAVAATVSWESARLWTADKPEGPWRGSNHWRASAGEAATPAGDGAALAAQAAVDGDARWQPLPAHPETTVPRAWFFVPLRLGRTARGVLEITVRLHGGDGDDLCTMLATLAACVGQFLERKESEKRMFEAEGAVSGAARAKSDFLALMSHEIRTPMNGVIGMSNLLLETQLTPKQRDFAQTIRSSGDSLLAVINDILDFSKIEAGKLPFDRIDFDLRSAIEDTLELMAGNAHAKHLELAAHVHADVPHFVHGDPNRLRQVLNNLVANAIKFTAQGEVIVTVAREATTDQRVVLRFAIRDTGIGIPPEVQKRLFQPFMQADTSTTRRYGGTGLGLAISRQLVEMMHGRIGVVSEEGKGATFHFTIRFDRAKEAGAETSLHQLAPAGARVLVVDDNASHAGILGHHLKAWGLRPTRAASVDAALNQTREALAVQEPFALALLDAELPGAPGTQLAHALRTQFAAAAPRVILIAGIGQQFDDADLRAAGAAAWVTKPVRECRLREAVATVLAGGFGPRPTLVATRTPHLVTGAAAPAAAGGTRILLVEDNVINQQVALQVLARLDLTADVAPNGLEALAALRRVPYEIVLMDCMMPHLDGYETTRRIREVERRRAALGIARPEVHIIALTANTSPEDRARCLAAGMNEFVPKPLRPEELLRLLERWRTQPATGAVLAGSTR